MKYGNPRRFECWRWDDRFIYHAVDHGLDGDSNESYMFTDGRWLARDHPGRRDRGGAVDARRLAESAGVVRRRLPRRPVALARVSVPAARLVRAAARRRRRSRALATRWCSNTSRTIRSARPAPPSTTTLGLGAGLVRVGAIGLPGFLQPHRRVQRADGSLGLVQRTVTFGVRGSTFVVLVRRSSF